MEKVFAFTAGRMCAPGPPLAAGRMGPPRAEIQARTPFAGGGFTDERTLGTSNFEHTSILPSLVKQPLTFRKSPRALSPIKLSPMFIGFLGAPYSGPSVYKHGLSLFCPSIPLLQHLLQRAPAEGAPEKNQASLENCRLLCSLVLLAL